MSESVSSIYNEIFNKSSSAPLSELLPIALRLARQLKNKQFENWIRLEMLGYFKENPALTKKTVVPEYRTVGGYHSDIYDRPLVIKNPKLKFINEDRLSYGIVELEKMEKSDKPLVIHDPVTINLIRENLNVEVHKFTFSPIMVAGVINGIRVQLQDWLYDIEGEIPVTNNKIYISPQLSNTERKRLRNNLQNHFDKTELREICFDSNIDYDNLSGKNKTEKVMELIKYFERRNQLPQLTTICQNLRPNIAW